MVEPALLWVSVGGGGFRPSRWCGTFPRIRRLVVGLRRIEGLNCESECHLPLPAVVISWPRVVLPMAGLGLMILVHNLPESEFGLFFWCSRCNFGFCGGSIFCFVEF